MSTITVDHFGIEERWLDEGEQQQVRELLRAIDALEVSVVGAVDRTWMGVSGGSVRFQLTNGWQLVVFNDHDQWDYVEAVRAPTWEHDVQVPYECDPCPAPDIFDWSPQNMSDWLEAPVVRL